ncbi:MAG TPA: FtsX-like permease family protein, partial [Gammaproteobacteria bacterium]|nr:FtsX-like permease family protein [Gammaproteobacteria bacterium]
NTATTVPVIFLGVAAFLLYVVVGRMVDQQRGEIAVLKACGYDNATVGLHYLQLVVLVTVVGLAIGTGFGAWFGHALAALYQRFFHFPFLDFVLPARVLAIAAGASLAAAVVGAMAAVRRAVVLPPAEAMRPASPTVFRRSWIEALGLRRWLDQPTRMVVRNIARHRLKTAIAVLGVALSAAMLVVSGFQRDAIDYMVATQFGFAQRESLSVGFTEPTGARVLSSLRALPGVRYVEPYRAVAVDLQSGPRSKRSAIQGLPARAVLHRVLDEAVNPLSLPPAGLVLSRTLADQLGVQAGDTVTAAVREGRRRVLHLPISAITREFVGSSAYMALPALNRALGEGGTVSGAFISADRHEVRRLFRRLQDAPRVASVGLQSAARKSFEESLGRTVIVFAIVNILLAGSIAFGVVYNTARLALSERGRELASLRVLGFSSGEVGYILLAELALISLAALVPGMLIGRWFCAVIAEAFTSDLYRIPLVLTPATYGRAATVVVVATVVSGWLAWRRLRRLDLVEVLKTRE